MVSPMVLPPSLWRTVVDMGDILALPLLLGDCENRGFLTPFLDAILLSICQQGLLAELI